MFTYAAMNGGFNEKRDLGKGFLLEVVFGSESRGKRDEPLLFQPQQQIPRSVLFELPVGLRKTT